ncbi:IS66 family transposase [Bacteroides ovatus]|uniref:IS66 family transposase n=1 Tax=Bacteroides ovatus TaxID=28116 RepID=UPI00189BA94A|nr:IS66 family transposase [Bacteroides ovatus]MDC2611003.1 IS66 family transposase [Bacteroides ovatus]
MEDKETINILIAQLLSKDDEILRLRNLLDDLQREQRSGNMQILSKLDRALEELKSMRHDNKTLSNRLSRALEAKSAAEEKIQELSSALEALENTRADELYEIARQKRQLYGRKSEKKSSLSAMKQKDLKEDKDDFDGSAPSAPVEDLEQKAAESASSEAAPRSESPSCRKDYGKQSTGAENVVVHYCDESDIPSGARKIGIREWIQYSIQHQVVKHVFKLVRLVDTQGNISNYYQPTDKNDTRRPFENVLEGYPVDFELMARILVDKYQYGLSLERVVDRLKDAGARFNTSTVLAWIKRHMKELCKLEEPFQQLLLTPGSMLFSDETTEQVRVYNQQKGKYEYRKQYIWGIKNPDRKIAYYLYDNGSRSMKVAQKFFAGFRGSVTTDGYNVYKMFEREDSSITRYGCMAHVRRKFVDALQTDHRSADIINLISNLYWVEADCRINLLSEDERRMERQKRAIPILAEIWQMIKPVFEQTRGDTANLFLKAVRYAVNEWEAVSRYVQNGKAEIDNNPAERMMKPICMGRKNYLFCGSELGAKNASMLYSIIETCKMNGLRPVKYIAEILTKLTAGETNYMSLLPINNNKE